MKKVILVFSVLSVFLSGCEKEPEPVAAFTLSTTYADVNELIFTTNLSYDAFSYLWNDGEGNETTEESPTLVYDSEGTYNVSLTAYSESGEKENTTTQSITVQQSYGEVTFWQSGSPAYGITTVIIGDVSAQITADYPNGPTDCFQSGCANFSLTTGTHIFRASDGNYNWSGTVTIVAYECIKFQLQ